MDAPMPPLYQDPLTAVPGAWRWVDLLRALVEVSSEAWALALIALAIYSFLETEVKGVLKVFLPLGAALLAAGAATLLVRALGALPRPAEAAGHSLAPLLRRAFPTAQSTAVVVFATYTALVYGRRGLLVAVPAGALGIVHALAGPHPFAEFTGGAAAGILLGSAAYGAVLRLSPEGHVAHRRADRNPGAATARPGSP
jgi:hypothetical protein